MDYLPICLKLQGHKVLLVGGGIVATRKARLLHRAGAVLDVLAPNITEELAELLGEGGNHYSTVWANQPLQGYRAIIAATPDRAVNREVSEAAQRQHIPVNVVDDPDLCSFIIPAIVDRTPLVMAISSSGSSPVLARRVRSDIESRYPEGYADVARFLGERREQLANVVTEERERRLFWEHLIDETELVPALLAQQTARAQALFDAALANRDGTQRGAVYLIGAGPGDPDLMTFKALRLLQRADVVLYDRLVGPGIVEMARRDAEKMYVGKQRAEHAMPQSEINATLLSLAQQGKRVARLKGGDPFIFGRGGEEIEGLMAAGVEFEVVPGITAASGAACYGGIPLTHRDYAQSVRFITGHTRNYTLDLTWADYLNPSETLVFYMGLAGLSIIAQSLIGAGRDPETPTAVVEKATLPQQRVLAATLATIEERVAQEQPQAPTLLIIGDVVRLHPTLGWYDGVSA